MLIGLLAGASVIFSDKIIAYVVSEINKNLTTKVDVQSIDFSVWSKFPNATIELQNVYALPAKPFSQKDTLLYAKKIYLLFDLMDVINGKYNLKKVSVEQATLKLITDLNGNRNYEVWKKDSTQKSGGSFKLNFEEVKFIHTQFVLSDYQQSKFYEILIEQSKLNGRFSDVNYDLHADADLFIYKSKLGKDDYIKNRKAKLNFNFKVDKLKNTFEFEPSTLQLEGLNLAVQGNIQYLEKSTLLHLNFNGKDADIISLLSFIPQSKTALKDYEAKGNVSFNANLSGEVSATQSPVVAINFSTGNSQLTPLQTSVTLSNISFKGFYTNKKSATNSVDFLSLENLKASLDGQPVSASFQMENTKHPFVNMMLNGKFDLKKLSSFYLLDTLQAIEGTLLVNANFKGQIGSASTYVSSGTAQLQQVNFSLKNSPTKFNDFSSTFTLQDNDLQIDRLTGKISNSDFRINGVIEDVFDYIFTKGEKLKIDADFLSNKLLLDEIIVSGNAASDTTGGIHFSPNLTCNLMVSIGELTYKKFVGKHISGSVTLEDGVLNTNSLNLEALDGTLKMQGSIDASRGDSVLISFEADMKQVNISKAFDVLNNFGQQVVTGKNVKGYVSARVQFASLWSRQLVLNKNSIYSKCDITIENGELLNLEPLLALSRYVKGTDLHDVKFQTLHNVIEIRNSKVVIPVMDIKSTAINLTASGTHGFDNIVDYKIQLELSQLLNRKVKDNNTEFGTVEDDGMGHWKLYLSMKGNISNPKFSYDKKSVKESIAKDIKVEKQNMKALLNKEFGWFKKDTTLLKPTTPQKKKEEILIDYDDNN